MTAEVTGIPTLSKSGQAANYEKVVFEQGPECQLRYSKTTTVL